eukprot:3894451-Pleurochrysis_carterae.AAC.2
MRGAEGSALVDAMWVISFKEDSVHPMTTAGAASTCTLFESAIHEAHGAHLSWRLLPLCCSHDPGSPRSTSQHAHCHSSPGKCTHCACRREESGRGKWQQFSSRCQRNACNILRTCEVIVPGECKNSPSDLQGDKAHHDETLRAHLLECAWRMLHPCRMLENTSLASSRL